MNGIQVLVWVTEYCISQNLQIELTLCYGGRNEII